MALRVGEYIAPDGSSPFRSWLAKLDIAVRARIQARVLRFELGNLGDHKSVGAGVWEARVMFGAGYRIYFGRDGASMILLLIGERGRRQVIAGGGFGSREDLLARLSGGYAAWQNAVKAGMQGWHRTFGT